MQPSLFEKVTTAVSHAIPLGIFAMETAHRFNQTCSSASCNLGRAKAWQLIAADNVLNCVLQRHRVLIRNKPFGSRFYMRSIIFCMFDWFGAYNWEFRATTSQPLGKSNAKDTQGGIFECLAEVKGHSQPEENNRQAQGDQGIGEEPGPPRPCHYWN